MINTENQNNDIVVTIRCITYNHEPYIRQCLEGFVMQKTNFRFEAIVHDDASIDGTAAIIEEYAKKYPDIIKPIFETENQYSKRDGSIRRIMNEHTHGKYVAMCEGDDYWIDPLKLQKQVDFLEENEDYGFVFTGSIGLDMKTNKNIEVRNYKNRAFTTEEILRDNPIQTATVLFRKQLLTQIPYLFLKQNWLMGDYPLWIECSLIQKVRYISDITSVYRILAESASHSNNIDKIVRFNQNANLIRRFYAKKSNKEYLIEQLDESYYSRMYVYFIINGVSTHSEYFVCKEFFNTNKVKTLKSKILKIICIHKVFEFLISHILKNRFFCKVYYKL